MVEFIHDVFEFLGSDRTEVAMLRQILSHETVGVLTEPALPRSVRMSKVNAYVEISGYFLMVSELATVV